VGQIELFRRLREGAGLGHRQKGTEFVDLHNRGTVVDIKWNIPIRNYKHKKDEFVLLIEGT
jgi:hypothetical protein